MTAATDSLTSVFTALADPTRRAILERLARGECSVSELAEPFAMSLPAVSKHLRVLERAGLISQRREAQRRPCRIEAAPLRDAAAWAEHVRATWEGRLDRLDAYLGELTGHQPPHRTHGETSGGARAKPPRKAHEPKKKKETKR
jgi:DNA-binding transcriptional ArsR family regulator